MEQESASVNRSCQDDSPMLVLWNSAAVRVGLSFHWRNDRYEHRLELIEGDRRSVLLASCEGADQEFWPPSPALQQLTFQQDGQGRPCVLLLGMAGKSHWSLSVEQDEKALIFDAACRVQERPARLGSSYRGARPSRWCPAGRLHVPVEQATLEIVVDSAPEGGVACREAGDGGLAITPLAEIKDVPATIRWHYQMRLEPLAGNLAPGLGI